MAKFWSLAALVVVGIIWADSVKNPAGTAAATGFVTDLEGNVGNQLLGSPSVPAATKKAA